VPGDGDRDGNAKLRMKGNEAEMKNGTKPPNSNHAAVGYCNPPEYSRFRKGLSGNPNGRPKGSLNMATVLERTLREKVVINEHGRSRTFTKLEVAVRQLIDQATSGELKALQLLSALVRSAEEREIHAPVASSVLDGVDEKVVLGIVKRIESNRKENQREEEQKNESHTQGQ
jgi:Family of unknown function (DUF5681)